METDIIKKHQKEWEHLAIKQARESDALRIRQEKEHSKRKNGTDK